MSYLFKEGDNKTFKNKHDGRNLSSFISEELWFFLVSFCIMKSMRSTENYPGKIQNIWYPCGLERW